MVGNRSLLLAAVAALALFAAASCVTPPPPPDPLIVCDSLLVSSAYTPPATNGADDVTGTVQSASGLSGCTDHTGRAVTTATLDGTFDVAGACSYHPPGEEWAWGTGQFTWSDGSASDYSGVLVAETPLRVEIRITRGLWSGATASVPMEINGLGGSCDAGGIADVAIEGGPFVLRPAGSSGPQALSGVAQVASGDAHTCALMSGGSVKCWGSNSSGQLGNARSGFMVQSLVAVDVVGLGSVTAVSAGGAHTCALIPGGEVRCWGANAGGQLGDGSTTASSVPVAVSGLTGATAISAGTTHTCAVVTGGAVKCWGEGDLVPTPVPGITGATDVSAGYSEQASARGPTRAPSWAPVRSSAGATTASASWVTAATSLHPRRCRQVGSRERRTWWPVRTGARVPSSLETCAAGVATTTGSSEMAQRPIETCPSRSSVSPVQPMWGWVRCMDAPGSRTARRCAGATTTTANWATAQRFRSIRRPRSAGSRTQPLQRWVPTTAARCEPVALRLVGARTTAGDSAPATRSTLLSHRGHRRVLTPTGASDRAVEVPAVVRPESRNGRRRGRR